MSSVSDLRAFAADTAGMAGLCERAWELFDSACVTDRDVVPVDSGPILFFGDLAAYRASDIRVVTVGLNPSLAEFPASRPWSRFPGITRPETYVDSLSAYFRTEPYRAWFNCYEPILNGMGASYYPGAASTALHTDLLSPVPTSPTWSKLQDPATRRRLGADGKALWRALVEELDPHVVVISVAREHVDQLELATPWHQLHVIERTNPYVVEAAELALDGNPLVVRGAAAQTPFGKVSNETKALIGQRILEVL